MAEFMKENAASLFGKLNIGQILLFIIYSALFMFEIVRLEDMPGLQMDNVVSDYAAVRYIHPQTFQDSHFAEVDNLRLIDTFYHGNLTMLWTLFVCLLTGTTSVLQYRIGTACWIILIIGCTQYILYRLRIKRILSVLIMLMLVSAQTTVSTVFTNYYTILPGTAFTLISLIFLFDWTTKKQKKNLYISSFFSGLAIYSYFIFVFYFFLLFVTAITVSCHASEKKQNAGTIIFTCCAGGFAGAYGYIMGYYSLALGRLQVLEDDKVLLFIAAGAVLALLNCLMYRLSQGDGKPAVKILLGIIACLCAVVAFILPNLNPSFRYWVVLKVTDSSSMELTIFERLLRIPHLISAYMRNSHREFSVLGYRVSKLSFLWRNIYFLVTAIWLVWVTYRIKKRKIAGLVTKCGIVLSFMQFGYLFLTFFIVSGMRPYHYTTFCFIEYPLAGIMVHDLLEAIDENNMFGFARNSIALIFCALITLNYMNTGIMTAHIKRTGGHNYYTNQMTELSREALRNQADGEKEFYFFPEWGFYMGFAYLTGNAIPYSHYPSQNYMEERMNEGYHSIILAFFNQENELEYRAAFGDYADNIDKKIWHTLDGEYAFTTLKLENEGQ